MSEDSGGAVMGRGGRSGDVRRLEDFFQVARDWDMREHREEQPLQQHQFESEGEPGDDENDKQPLHSWQFGTNSPAKGAGKRKGGTTSAVWSVIKRLKDPALMGLPEGTPDTLLPPRRVHVRVGSDSDSVFSEERCVQVQIHSVSTSH